MKKKKSPVNQNQIVLNGINLCEEYFYILNFSAASCLARGGGGGAAQAYGTSLVQGAEVSCPNIFFPLFARKSSDFAQYDMTFCPKIAIF